MLSHILQITKNVELLDFVVQVSLHLLQPFCRVWASFEKNGSVVSAWEKLSHAPPVE